MPLSVNQNLAATGVLVQLKNNEVSYQKEISRLSSGLRINSAADDPAGLVISEKYKAQVDGLSQAINNANDAVNLTQTADGALSEISNQLQSMRTLALHAANTGPNDANAIAADQQQISSAIATINRIATTTQFGTRKLLDGSSGTTGASQNTGVQFMSGSNTTQAGTYDVNITQASTEGSMTSLGALTTESTTGAATNGAAAGSATSLTFAGAGVNGGANYTFNIASTDDINQVAANINSDATLKAAGISARVVSVAGGQSQLQIGSASAGTFTVKGADANATSVTGISNAAAQTATATAVTDTSLLTQNETLTFGNSAGAKVSVQLNAGQTYGDAVSTINTALQGANIDATATLSGGKLTLKNTDYGSSANVSTYVSTSANTASATANGDGRHSLVDSNFNIVTSEGNTASGYNIANGSDSNAGALNATDGGYDVAGTIGGLSASGKGQILSGAANTAIGGLNLKITATTAGDKGNITVSQNAMTFQIGAFADQTVTMGIDDVRANQLGTTAIGISSNTATTNVASIDVTKGAGVGAQDALKIIDAAIDQVSTLRASLGSFQADTLQSSVRNMMVAEQNMQTSESQITDANMAQETLAYSRAQILQQTGLAMLTQANQAPNQLLSLFRG